MAAHQKLHRKIQTIIANRYKKGENTYKLAKEYGVMPGVIISVLKRRGIDRRNKRECNRKYAINQKYFDNINTPEKAYFLGFFYADGYNNVKDNIVFMNLQERDRHILERFKELLQWTGNLRFIKMSHKMKQNQYCFEISSLRLSQRLLELGCPQAKSLILKFPSEEQVPKRLMRHFLRGYFDGDGCFYLVKNRKGIYNWGNIMILGTKHFCDGIAQVMLERFNMICHVKPIGNIFRFYIGGNLKVEKFLKYIYRYSTIHLNRKHEKVTNFLLGRNYVIPKSSRRK